MILQTTLAVMSAEIMILEEKAKVLHEMANEAIERDAIDVASKLIAEAAICQRLAVTITERKKQLK